jgi:hypothetical protein
MKRLGGKTMPCGRVWIFNRGNDKAVIEKVFAKAGMTSW